MNYLKLNVILIVVLVSTLELYSNQEVTTAAQPETSSSTDSTTDSTTMAPSDQTTTASTVQNRSMIIQRLIDLVRDNPNFWYMNEREGLFVLREIPSDDNDDEDW